MSGYNDFPPFCDFKRVLQSCPQAAFPFSLLWKMKGKDFSVSVRKKEVKKRFLVSPTVLRSHLLAMGRLDILSFEESIDYFKIDFFEGQYV